ncbi:reverse transcriptase domain-containing protein [Tanacetum coccineum]|uniref:Reverse transcriptase domain-containing protein n=1 Tax=Tanacetum coccineum TaxID=301880 RepID=A0ABQ4Y8W3_9ASTR
MADMRTMSELLQAPTEGYGDAITTNLKNDILNFQQRFDETFSEAWDHFKDLLSADGNLLNRTPRDALTIIENKSKVHTLRNKLVISKMSSTTSSSTPTYLPEITALTDAVKAMLLQNKTPLLALVKAIEEICVTCGGLHSYYECLATDGNTFNAFAATGTYNQGGSRYRPQGETNYRARNQMRPPGFPQPNVQNNQNRPSGLGSLSINTVTNPRGDLKVITTRSGVSYDGPTIPPTSSRLSKEVEHKPEATKDKLKECLALADLGASINLIPLSVWKNLLLPEHTPTRMTLKLANQSVAYPIGVVEYVFVKVGKFHFPADFVVVDYDADPWVPLILGRPFLRMARALIDVQGEQYDDESVNQIDVIDVTCEEYAQEVLSFLDNSKKEIEASLTSDSIPPGIDDADFDPERDILLLEKLLNDVPSSPLPPKEIQFEELKIINLLLMILLSLSSRTYLLILSAVLGQCDLEKKEISGTFPLETLGMISFHGDSSTPWFADIANYHAGNFVVKGMSSQQKKKILEGCEALFLGRPLLAFRTTLKCTPYKLVYGKACHLPIELEHKAYWALKYCNLDLKSSGDHQKVKMNDLNELRDQAYENSLIYKEKMKKIHDSKIKNNVFNIGHRVLPFNSRLKIFSGKLKIRWTRPLIVTKVFPYGTIELSQTDRPNFKDYPDYEDSRARGFVHRSLELLSFARGRVLKIECEVECLKGLNDDNNENMREGYGSVRRRLVKKAERVDSFDVKAMAIANGGIVTCGGLCHVLNSVISNVSCIRTNWIFEEWKNANRNYAKSRSLLTRAMEDGKPKMSQVVRALEGDVPSQDNPISENSGGELNSDISREMLKGETEADDGSGNKVMVVVDSNMESKGALHWALDDTVQNQDTMILLHIATGSKLVNQRAYEHLCSLKKNLETIRPESEAVD